MCKKILLPFEDRPYLQMYHNNAFPMGIVQGNANTDIVPWLCMRNINCWFDAKAKNKFSISVEDAWPTADRILVRQSISLYTELFKKVFPNTIALFQKMLDKGCYPHGEYNEEYIPGKEAYQKSYFAHDFLLIGYDDDDRHFVSVGYLSDGKFQRFTIPYENMEQAVQTLKNSKVAYSFWSYNADAIFVCKIERILSDLQDYLYSTASFQKAPKNKVWGISAIETLVDYFFETARTYSQVDFRYTRGLMEHKFFMHMRTEYFYQQGFLKDEILVEQAKQNYQLAEKVHLLALKYNMTQKETILVRIREIIQEILETERSYLPKVLSCLQICRGVEK